MHIACNILFFLERAAKVFGQRIAIIDPFLAEDDPLRQLTYEGLWNLVHAQARAFAKLGLPQGAKIAILSDNNTRFFISLFSISGFKRIVVPINFRLNSSEIKYIIQHSDASLILVDHKSYALVKDLNIKSIIMGPQADLELFCDDSYELERTNDENFPASINYTSGTTALPKGVVLTHRNLYMAALTFAMHLSLRDGEVYLHTLPLFHCNGWGMPYILSVAGATHVIHQNCTGRSIITALREYSVTQINGAPTVIQRLIESMKEEPQAIHARHQLRILVAGAAPPVKMIEEVETVLKAEFIQLYGLTETAPLLTTCQRRFEWDQLSPSKRAQKLSQAGAPALGVTLSTAPDGEILAQSNNVLASYYKDADATKEALENGWFHTGDNGIINDEGYLVLTDRKKDIIISGGENISSLEVENILYLNPQIQEAAVIGIPDKQWGETVIALIVLKTGAPTTKEEIISHCRTHLAHFKCPKRIDFVDELPRTATGKLQKFKLRELYC
jgi:acyl-CoA synthetase (AMP-forming)/AMP-acid ligase II